LTFWLTPDLKNSDLQFRIRGRDPIEETTKDDEQTELPKDSSTVGGTSYDKALSTTLEGTQASQTR